MKTIPLTKGLVAMVDDEDYDRVNNHKWTVYTTKKKSSYANRGIKVDGKWTHISLHRFIMDAPKGVQVDHIDGDGFNNQKSNLRLCTVAQNARNMNAHKDNKHGLKGIRFATCNKNRPWVGQIYIDGKNKSLGYFPSKIDAAIAYNIAAVKHFGEFARLNPIPFTL